MERSQKRCRPANPARRDPRCARSRTHRLASEARLKQRTSGGMIFLPADNVESKCAILISAMISFKISRPRDFKTKRFQDQEISRPKDLKTKIGDQTMMHRLTREENQPAGRRPAFSTAEAIAMSVTSSRRGVDEPRLFNNHVTTHINVECWNCAVTGRYSKTKYK